MLIGEFARAGRVSIRMLRHYDQIGLLRPDRVDPHSGHRHYREGQLADLHRLLALKALGFSLEQVRQILQEQISTDRLHQMLTERRAELRRQLRQDQHRLARVEARLAMIGKDSSMTPHGITTTTVAPVHLAAVGRQHPGPDRTSAGAQIEALFTRASDLADTAGLSRLAPMGWYPAGKDGVHLYTGFVIDPHDTVGPGLTAVPVPAARVASLLHVGEMSAIGQTYAELGRWARAQGVSGPLTWREMYLEADGQNQSDWIVEVQVELPGAT